MEYNRTKLNSIQTTAGTPERICGLVQQVPSMSNILYRVVLSASVMRILNSAAMIVEPDHCSILDLLPRELSAFLTDYARQALIQEPYFSPQYI